MADINISELPNISLATDDDVFVINDADSTTSKITWGELQSSITKLTDQITFGQGTESQPSITFVGDLNLGIFSPGLDTIGIATNGTERFRIDAAGNAAFGNNAPSDYNSAANNLVVGNTSTSDNGITVISSTADTGNIYFADGLGLGAEDAGTITYDHSDDHIHINTAGSERLRINAIGTGFGTSSIKSNVHVRGGDSGITATPSNQSGIIIENGTSEAGALQFYNAPDTDAYIKFGDSGALDSGYIRYLHSDDSLRLQTLGTEKVHITSGGDVAIGVGGPTSTVLDVNNQATGSSSYTGIKSSSEIQSDVTLDYRYFRSTASTQGVSFNLTDLHHFSATQEALGNNSSIDNQFGFSVDSGLSGASNNYGFYSGLNSGTDNYAFYAAGSADNYFNGDNFIIDNGGVEAVRVTGGILEATGGVTFTPGDTLSRPTGTAGLMRFNSDVSSWEGYNGFSWGAIGGGAKTGGAAPINANEGDIWFDADVGRTYIYYNDGDSVQWVEMNPSLNGGVATNTVGTPQLVDSAVTDVKILDLNVTSDKLATNSVTASKIQDGSVTPTKLDRSYLELGGGTMSGQLTLLGGGTGNNAATVSELDTVNATATDALPKSGGTMTGDIAVSAGQGIDFSAVSSNGDNKRLLDFEEGTFTPKFVDSQTGADAYINDALVIYSADYTKIGNIVFFSMYIEAGSSTTYAPGITSLTDLGIGGLPYTSKSSPAASGFSSATVGYYSNWASYSQGYSPMAHVVSGQDWIWLGYANGASVIAIDAIQMTAASASGIMVSGQYRVA